MCDSLLKNQVAFTELRGLAKDYVLWEFQKHVSWLKLEEQVK